MDFVTGVGYVLRSIFALGVIIILANVVLKKLQQVSGKQAQAIQIIERVSVSKSSALALAKIGGQYYLMSINESSSEILKEFSAEEVATIEQELGKNKSEQTPSATLVDSIKNMRKKYQGNFENKSN